MPKRYVGGLVITGILADQRELEELKAAEHRSGGPTSSSVCGWT
jgi:hypothetical protein